MIKDKGSKIRPIQVEDLPLVLEWRNSERIRSVMYTDQLIRMDQHLAWFERLHRESDRLTLIYEHEGQPSGVINFTDISTTHRRCMWGFYLGVVGLPSGTGTDMGRLALQYAFETLQVEKICGEVFAFNEVSIRLHLRLGFEQEGYFYRHVCKNGAFEDIRFFSLFKNRFEGRIES